MGLGHPDLMAEVLTQRQVHECWRAYQLEPWGELREDYRNAALRQTLIAVQPNFGKKRPKLQPLDSLRLRFEPAKPPRPLADKWRELRAIHNASEAGRAMRRKG